MKRRLLKITTAKRFSALCVDYTISLIVGLSLYVVIALIFPIHNLLLTIILRNFLVAIILICKDICFNKDSLGKQLYKLEIVTFDNKRPTKSVKVLRNMTIIIWPIELILLILFQQRLGDILCKTKVVEIQNK